MNDEEQADAGLEATTEPAPIDEASVLVVRRGASANCSSIGSALDVLFVTAAVAGAILVAVTAALANTDRDDPEASKSNTDARTP